ncbi:MAG: PAS domain S-box protein [Candidatus Thorarchaeota archaeon]
MTSLVGVHLPSCYILAEQITDGFVIIDNASKVVHSNRAFADILGYQVREMESQTLSGILHANSREFHPGLAAKETIEITLRSRTGLGILADVVSGTIQSQAGPTGFYLIVRPILMEQEEAMRKYQALFEETNDGVFIMTLEGIMIDSNKQGLEMLGYERQELLGRSYFDTIAPSEVDDSSERLDILKKGESLPVYERTFKRKDGNLFPVEINMALISDDSGEPLYLQSIVRDISSRKAAEKELRESEERIRRLIDTSPDAITVASLDGHFEMVSAQTAILHGYENAEEMIGMDGFSLTPEEGRERAAEIIMRLVKGEDIGIVKTTLLRKDGSSFPAEMRMSILRDENDEPTGIMGITRDVTDQVKAERILRESEERLDLALKGAKLGVWDWDAENDIFHFDEGYARILGYDVNEMGTSYGDWESLIHPNDLELLEARWLKHVEDRSIPYVSEHRMRTKSGEYKWVMERGSVLELNEEGGTKRATGTILDIADRKQAEEALKTSEERYRRLVETSPDAIVVGDLDGNIRMANRIAQKISGYDSEKDLIGKSFFDFVSVEDRGNAKEIMLRAIHEGREIPESVRLILLRADNSTYLAEVNGTVIRDSDGTPESFVVVVRDITGRQKIEMELRESEGKYRALAEQSIQGLAIMAGDGVVYCNQTYADIMGRSVEEIIDGDVGSGIWDVIHSDDRERLRERYREYMKGGKRLGSTKYRILRPDGEIRWVESFASIIDYAGSQAMQSSIIDITEKHQASEAQKRAEEALRGERDRAQLYLDMAGVIFLVLNREGKITLLNRKGCEVFSCSPSEAIGTSWFKLVPERERIEVRAAFNQLMSGSLEEIERQERHIVTFNDEERLIEWSSVVLKDDEGQIIGLISSGEDITEKRWAEAALKESEERYRTLVQSMQDLVFVYNEKDRNVEFYGAEKQYLVAPPEEFLGRHVKEILPPEMADAYLENVQAVRESGETRIYDYPLEVRGIPHWFSAKMSRHEDEKSVISVVRDITARVLAEETVKRERRAFKLIAEAAVYSKSVDDLCSQVLSGLIETLGFEKGSVSIPNQDESKLITISRIGMKDELLAGSMPLDEEAGRKFVISNVALTKKPIFAPDISVDESLDSFYEWLERLEIRSAIVWPLLDSKKDLLGVLGIASKDKKEMEEEARIFFETVADMFAQVLEKLRSQEALAAAEEKFRSIFNEIPIGLQLLEQDSDGALRLVEVNPAIDSMLNTSGTSLVGKTLEEIASSHQRAMVIEQCRRVVKEGIPWHTEDVRVEEDQVIRAVRTSIFPVLPGMIAVSFLDLTDRVRAEREVRRLNEQLNKLVEERTAELASANKELEAFAYTVSHDLRAPLRTMDGFSQALLEDYKETLDNTGKDYLERIRRAAIRMAGQIDDILDLSRVTRLEMDRVSVNLSLMAEEVIKDLRESDPERNPRIVIEEGLRNRCDRRLMRAALQNLLSNAWKFTSSVDEPIIEFGSVDVEGESVYYVKDNGAGFEMEFAERLFKPFQRLHKADEFEGSGIGLATVERAISRHGGRVWAEGETGKGATFYFTLRKKAEDSN